MNKIAYPTMKEVEAASRFQLCKWHRFLQPPVNDEQVAINNRLFERWKEEGGFTPSISKQIGWNY